jgi:hypothetical protein
VPPGIRKMFAWNGPRLRESLGLCVVAVMFADESVPPEYESVCASA